MTDERGRPYNPNEYKLEVSPVGVVLVRRDTGPTTSSSSRQTTDSDKPATSTGKSWDKNTPRVWLLFPVPVCHVMFCWSRDTVGADDDWSRSTFWSTRDGHASASQDAVSLTGIKTVTLSWVRINQPVILKILFLQGKTIDKNCCLEETVSEWFSIGLGREPVQFIVSGGSRVSNTWNQRCGKLFLKTVWNWGKLGWDQ